MGQKEATMPEPEEDDIGGDLDQGDLDDLGELGDAEEDEDGADNGSAGASGAPWKAPSKSEWDRLQRRIKRLTKPATADVDKELQRRLGGKPPKGKDAEEDEDGPNVEAEHWRGVAIQNAASAQITAAGFSGTARQAARLARLIDTAQVAVGRDGSVDLEDEIEELKEEYPQLFQAASGRRVVPKVRRQDGSGDAPKKSPTQRTSEALMRGAGYL
jgi:hypothetical protein